MLLINHLFILFTFAFCSPIVGFENASDRCDVSHTQIEQLCHNSPQVLAAYERFEGALLDSDFSDAEVNRVLDAVDYLSEKKDTRCMLNSIRMAHFILVVSGDASPEVLMAALLYKTVDENSFKEIHETFGSVVEGYVREVSCSEKLSLEAMKIKLADALSQLTQVYLDPPATWSAKRCDKYIRFAEQVIANHPDASPELKAELNKLLKAYWEKRGTALSLDDKARLESSDLSS